MISVGLVHLIPSWQVWAEINRMVQRARKLVLTSSADNIRLELTVLTNILCKNAYFWQSQICAIKIFKANLVALLNFKPSISSIFLLVQLILTDFAKEIVYAAVHISSFHFF